MTLVELPSSVRQRDDEFYWDNVCFSVEDRLFKVPRYHLVVGSEQFAQKYNLCPVEPKPDDEATDPDTAVVLEGITAAEFRTFLRLCFPRHSTSTTSSFTKLEWLTILKLATLWHFLDFRELAIRNLSGQLVDPIESISVGREMYVPAFVERGYMALITKEGLISNEDSEKIGYKTAVNIYIARQSTANSNGLDDIKRHLDNTPVLAEELCLLEAEASQRQRTRKGGSGLLPGQVEGSTVHQSEVEGYGVSGVIQPLLKKDEEHANSRQAEAREGLRKAQEELSSIPAVSSGSRSTMARAVNLLMRINSLKELLERERASSHCLKPVDGIAGSKRDDIYFWDMVTFSVEGILFRVPRYQFTNSSQYFAAAYLNGPSNISLEIEDLAWNDGMSEYSDEYEAVEAPNGSTPTAIGTPIDREPQFERVIALEDVTAAQFRTFLKLLFPIYYTSTTLTLSKLEWFSILTLSTVWHFDHFRALAIHHLGQVLTDPIELIRVGRDNFVPEWVLRGYEALIMKDEAIEEDESDMIGDRASVKLYIIRHGLARRLKEHEDTAKGDGRSGIEGHSTHAAFVRDQLNMKFRAELVELKRGELRIAGEKGDPGGNHSSGGKTGRNDPLDGQTGGKEPSDDQSTGETDAKRQGEAETPKERSEKPAGIPELGIESGGNLDEGNISMDRDETNIEKESGGDTTELEIVLEEGQAKDEKGDSVEGNAKITRAEWDLGKSLGPDVAAAEDEEAAPRGREDEVNHWGSIIGKETDGQDTSSSRKPETEELSTEENERQRQKLERKHERRMKLERRRQEEEEKRTEDQIQMPNEKPDSAQQVQNGEDEQQKRKKAEELREQAVLEELHRVQEPHRVDAEKQKIRALEDEREAKAREEHRLMLAKVADQLRSQQAAEESERKKELEALRQHREIEASWRQRELESLKRYQEIEAMGRRFKQGLQAWRKQDESDTSKKNEAPAVKRPGEAAVQTLVRLWPSWK
ncbi:hypothetical protein EST38_g2707 [Candolleomyces aberdarensis]|uniref:BTB domain-containing protein n=1 Tax=Candolleomyces aberdarensis TaxID=2316362 RepID=A0A4Q2DVG1_9AGAR|nr:hypothetical protein EST38_g2707 [Candolleomyces aberdarensis]